ncbi:MAG: type II and III secretion system protein family protein [Planctomycetaceae bacterium]
MPKTDFRASHIARCGLGLLLTVAFSFPSAVVVAQSDQTLTNTASPVNFDVSETVQRLDMIVKSSRILRVEGRIPKFQVHNEEVLSATPVSENQIQIFAKAPGSTQLNLWDTDEKLYTVDVTIVADAREVEGILSSQLPQATLRVMPLEGSAIVSGTVTSADDVDQAIAIVEQFYPRVINNIKVIGVQQVLLHTKIMEVSRTKLRDLGVDWAILGNDANIISAPSGFIDATLQAAVSGSETANARIVSSDFDVLIRALRQDDLVKLLAEPTVVATHGRPARFNVGGRVPYIVPNGNGSSTIAYEEFGTSVDFLPFVVGPGRIRLEVRPEVTEPDATRGIVTQGTQITGFTTRYVETAVEMQAGQTFAIAGLLQSRTEATTRRTPFLGELPYVGTLFRRVKERRNDIELLITVTPEFVEAMEPHEVPCGGPGLSTTSPTDKELYWKGYIEVPNLYGDCACNEDGSAGPCAQGGPALGDQGMIQSQPIIPAPVPRQLGNGVSIEAPAP